MARHHTPRVALTCETCGKTVMLPPSIVAQGRRNCSARCMGIAKSRPVAKTCVGCGCEFITTPSQARLRKYCGIACRREHEKPTITCVVCGKQRRVSPSVIQKGARFCSWECARKELNAPRPVVKCEMCGRERSVPPSDARVRRFCSHSCRTIHHLTHEGMKPPTTIEIALYECLDALGVEYIPQHPIVEAGTITDAFVPALRLVLHADGGFWHSLPKTAARDRSQDERLAALGFTVRRLSEGDLRANPLETVRAALAA